MEVDRLVEEGPDILVEEVPDKVIKVEEESKELQAIPNKVQAFLLEVDPHKVVGEFMRQVVPKEQLIKMGYKQ